MSIYKDCDIRGIYGEEFDAEEMRLVGRAIGRRLSGRSIVVAGDVRVSTPAIRKQLLAGLADEGAHIIDIGIAPTPVAYFAKSKACFDAYALAIVTASHNPAKYNGIKLMLGELPPTPAEIKEIEAEVKLDTARTGSSGSIDSSDSTGCTDGAGCTNGAGCTGSSDSTSCIDGTDKNRLCRYEQINISEKYCDHIKTLTSPVSDLKVVLDIGNGTSAGIAPALYRALGYDVVELFGEPDGTFPNRDPNPSNYRNLGAICEKVIRTGADFGVAFDGDGDRAVFIDDKGRPVINEKSLILLTRHAVDKYCDFSPSAQTPMQAPTQVPMQVPVQVPVQVQMQMPALSQMQIQAPVQMQAPAQPDNENVSQAQACPATPEFKFSVVYDQKCSEIVPKAIREMGGKPILERSGHAFIKKTFLSNESIIAGEISGHFFFRELGYDDGFYAGLCIGECIGKNSLSELSDAIPTPFISPDLRYKIPYSRMDEILAKIKSDYEMLNLPVSTYDGVRVSLPDGWFLVRKSVTEEAITLKIEADSAARIEEIKTMLEDKFFHRDGSAGKF